MHELRLAGVTRTFGERRALDDVTFTVRPGRVTGFIGANGAGKTTAMRIVVGVLAPDSGTVTWGERPVTRADRRRFGYMPEERGLYPKMPVLEQLVYLGRVHGLRAGVARGRAEALLAQLGLEDRAGEPLQTLSLGNQQRVQVAAALVHDPVALVLDEPFSGLDPLAVDAMATLLRERSGTGVPVLFSSHQLELVERLCDDVVIVDHGRVVAAGSADEVRAAHTARRLRVCVEVPGGAPGSVTTAGPDLLAGVPGVVAVRAERGRLVADLTEDADDQDVLVAAQRAGTVREFAPVVPTLAEIFREVVR
ncbi:ABC transporter ATP-binding protein [Actinotalea sp. Marseille-Q4924]|uniref:ABC transporter ATP-binding protein n=1 Tax=Actinotalea sp. Marseille-Q4924 TaxID=2866571 RepID=UPI001CE4830E|nr:ATP-binding cassette domain-containing protein [Actinotalea sp. Marseille-Q4924]